MAARPSPTPKGRNTPEPIKNRLAIPSAPDVVVAAADQPVVLLAWCMLLSEILIFALFSSPKEFPTHRSFYLTYRKLVSSIYPLVTFTLLRPCAGSNVRAAKSHALGWRHTHLLLFSSSHAHLLKSPAFLFLRMRINVE